MQDKVKAFSLAETALQTAMNKVDDVKEEDYGQFRSIIELLKENITKWKDVPDEDNDIDDL
jgi:hypothetical protein